MKSEKKNKRKTGSQVDSGTGPEKQDRFHNRFQSKNDTFQVLGLKFIHLETDYP